MSPIWEGTYQSNSDCNKRFCCCLTGQLVLVRSTANLLSFRSNTSGRCGSHTLIYQLTTYPTDYILSFSDNTYDYYFKLSSDSSIITGGIVSGVLCTVTATKTMP